MNNPGEITYYEELGVDNSATPEEIREAFRALVRLMHPDHQTDEQLKMMADWQMRKVNRIYAVLSDPDRRRRYDLALQAPPAKAPALVFSPDPRVPLNRFMARFAWIAAAVGTIVILVWLASENSSPVPLTMVDHVSAQNPIPTPRQRDEMFELRSELNSVKAQRDAAIHELTRMRGTGSKRTDMPSIAEPPSPQERSAAMPAVAAAFTELPPSVPPVARTAPAPQKKFAGFWFYTRPALGQQNHNKALYLPEFIETTITEQGALVHGRYRSRYQIVDRAISPDVNFEFVAAPEASTIICPWLGPGGARGELTLKLTGENSMEIAWTATELGSVQGLASGTARLTRRPD